MSTKTDFQMAAEARAVGTAGELLQFLMENKKWWLLPIVLLLCLFGVLAAFATTGAAPFIYTLF